MKTFTCTARCKTCNKILNTAHGVPENEKSKVTVSAPLATAGMCEHSTLSDLNYHFTLEWTQEHPTTA